MYIHTDHEDHTYIQIIHTCIHTRIHTYIHTFCQVDRLLSQRKAFPFQSTQRDDSEIDQSTLVSTLSVRIRASYLRICVHRYERVHDCAYGVKLCGCV
jgi:hypothetical protein